MGCDHLLNETCYQYYISMPTFSDSLPTKVAGMTKCVMHMNEIFGTVQSKLDILKLKVRCKKLNR